MSQPVLFETISGEHALSEYPVECFYRDDCQMGANSGLHWHLYSELVYINKGSYQIDINEHQTELSQGDLVYISPGQIHRAVCNYSDGTAVTVLKFDPAILKSSINNATESSYLAPFFNCVVNQKVVFLQKETIDTPLLPLLKKVLAETAQKKFGYEYAVHNAICDIILILLRILHASAIDSKLQETTYRTESLNNVFKYISENFTSDISADEISQVCNLSYSNFSIKFKNLTRKTFVEYVNFTRILYAQELLLSTNQSITEVSICCGFNDVCYFVRVFKKIVGVSPLQFKKNNHLNLC